MRRELSKRAVNLSLIGINWAYQQVLSRLPQPAELEIITNLYEKHQAEYTANLGAADALVAVGETP